MTDDVYRRSVVACRSFEIAPGLGRRRLELPTGYVTVVFGFAGPVGLTPVGRPMPVTASASLVGGVDARAVIGSHVGGLCGIEVSLRPTVASRILALPMAELAGRFADPGRLLGVDMAEFEARLAACGTWRERRAHIEVLLARRWQQGRACPPEIERAWQLLHAGRRESVEAVARDVGWDRRRLARRFQEFVGLSARDVIQVARLQRALRLEADGVPLTAVAHRAGYHDQAHLNHVFADVVGMSPGAFRRAAGASRTLFGAQDRIPGFITSVLMPQSNTLTEVR
ncbi:MAG: helix-turn-helix domain-containing protein [Catenulispora sp.]